LASVALVLTLGAAACGPQVLVPGDESTTAESTGPATTTVATLTTTTATTIASTADVATMTDEGPSTTTLEGSSSSDAGDDFPCAFYACPPDVGDPTECDLFAQDCPVGEKCAPWFEDSPYGTRCVPVAPDPGAAGDACAWIDGVDDCDFGLLCWVRDGETEEGTCVPQCGGTLREPTCPEAGQVCAILNDELVTVCFDACDPLLGDCPADSGCHRVVMDFVCIWTYEPGVYGDACYYVNDCDPGHTCLAETSFPACATGGCCTPFCDVTQAEPCPEAELGVACVPVFEEGMAPAGHEDVGVCALPP
jgi:hypothetical protein